MKPEPLRNKKWKTLREEAILFNKKDIKSAVEWFKREFVRKFKGETIDMIDVTVLINEAFEDVIK
jgi:hypothetical protein